VTARAPGDWLGAVAAQGHAVIEQTAVELPDQATEYMLMAMRLTEGADLARYERLAGKPLDDQPVAGLAAVGLVRQTGDRLAATARGRIVLNRVLAELLA
jgi:oxygen-independent coproporphyrinogen-3 oxidase